MPRMTSAVSDRSMTAPLAYRIDEAAEQANVSRSTLYRLIATGKLRTIKIGRCRLIPTASLQKLMGTGATI